VRTQLTATTDPEIAHKIDVAGIETNYHDQGLGTPVLLIHGSGPGVTAWANWRGLIPVLSSSHRVIAPDVAGFGYTDAPKDFQYNPATWTAHMFGLLDALGLPRVSVIGNSLGGALALKMAIDRPERIDRVVTMGTAGIPHPITDGLEAVWGYQPALDRMRKLLDFFLYDTSIVSPDLADLRYRATLRPGAQERFASMFPAPRQKMLDSLALPEEALRALPHRTLLVHGREDQVVPVLTSERLSKLIPNSDLHVFGKCGHWSQIEKADEFAELVQNFLSRP
jgi:2-hydroxymuconate-semialdehyde hydrolase